MGFIRILARTIFDSMSTVVYQNIYNWTATAAALSLAGSRAHSCGLLASVPFRTRAVRT